MTLPQRKLVQYLSEVHAMEMGLVRELQSQIALTPRGRYRSALEAHLLQTRSHAGRVQSRLRELGDGNRNPIQAVACAAGSAVGQAFAFAKTPLSLLRGSGGEEKVLKNAKDACASESLEIASYTALERLAVELGDETTAKLAVSIRADEEKMLARIMREIPSLAARVVRADVDGESSYDITETGAADAVRDVAESTKQTAKETTTRARRATRQARKVPAVATAEGIIKGALASEADLPIAGYDSLTAEEVGDRLSGLSQIDLAKIEAYERKNQSRSTITNRIDSLRGDEPWPGYDDMTAEVIIRRLRGVNDERLLKSTRAYERAHKNRAGVLKAAERELAHA